jgi:hypothetical protein
MLGGELHPGTAWSTHALGDGTTMAPSLTMDSTGRGVGVYTSALSGAVGYAVWSGGTWSPLASIAGAMARSQPFVDATGGTVSHVAYQDSTYHYWYLAYTGTWSSPQQIGVAGNQYYGPFAASIAALGTSATAAFFDGQAGDGGANINWATASDRVAGTWQAKVDIAGNTVGGSNTLTIPPAIVPLSAGPQLMMVYVQAPDVMNHNQIVFVTRTSGTWSAPASINNCLTHDPVGLAPLPSGGAILAFRGEDMKLYWSLYSGGAWSTVAPFATPNVSVATPPAVAHGVGGGVAEMAFVQIDGMAYHARLTGSTWSAPVLVGGASLSGVAIASAP